MTLSTKPESQGWQTNKCYFCLLRPQLSPPLFIFILSPFHILCSYYHPNFSRGERKKNTKQRKFIALFTWKHYMLKLSSINQTQLMSLNSEAHGQSRFKRAEWDVKLSVMSKYQRNPSWSPNHKSTNTRLLQNMVNKNYQFQQ